MVVEHEEVITAITEFHWELFLSIDELRKDPIGLNKGHEEIVAKCANLVIHLKDIITQYLRVFLNVPLKTVIEKL